MGTVDDLADIEAAVRASGLTVVDATFPPPTIELDAPIDEVLDTLRSLGAATLYWSTISGELPDLGDAVDTDTLIAEYRERFDGRPALAAVATGLDGLLVGAIYEHAAWSDFEDRCYLAAAVGPPAPTSTEIDTWADLCAQDPAFRAAPTNRRRDVITGIIGRRVTRDIEAVVETEALDLLAASVGADARAMRSRGLSKEKIRIATGATRALVEQWLLEDTAST